MSSLWNTGFPQSSSEGAVPSRPLPVESGTARSQRSQSYWSTRQLSTGFDPSISSTEREQAFRQWGNFSLAFSVAHQPRLKYFGNRDGFLAFGTRSGYSFALGDPLCPPARLADLIKEFVLRYPQVSFVQITEPLAELLQEQGFFINDMGVDTRLTLENYSFSGKDKEWLRYAQNWTKRRGYRIIEAQISDFESEIERVSESWRRTRTIKRKEVRFLNRPIPMNDECGVRRFFLFAPDGRLEAFVFFDPLFEAGKLSGYVTCIKRRRPDSPTYAEPAIMKTAIEQFQSENVAHLWLGLSPLARIQNQRFRTNRWLDRSSRYFHHASWFNRWFYNFKGHAEYKQRFRGEEVKVYYASRAHLNSFRLIALASLCGAF